jgi:oxygen-independent coproporphyrinogen III oxidase
VASPYVAYAYSYPHKTAYRPLHPPRELRRVWGEEKTDALFLYLHIPFCEMRCGFCNLFTAANPQAQLTDAYLDAQERQAKRVAGAIGPLRIARMAVGGGTPTYLDARQLERVMRIGSELYGIAPGSIPVSVETSPRTAEADRLRVLKDFGVSRVSIGVQSFVESEVQAAQRAQKNAWVDRAIQRIRDLRFEILNLDLIYGLPGQTVESFLLSLSAALRWTPEEMYLYPLYVRPLTGLGRRGCDAHDELRLACYRAGREMLLGAGYEQISMRMFRRAGSGAGDDPVYCCQDDGMIGLGCGARSYTRRLHYSSEFAVGAAGVREIIASYVSRSAEQFDLVDYGCEISDAEYRRRWVIKSLFRASGLDRAVFGSLFGVDVLDEFRELLALAETGYLNVDAGSIRPTPLGLEWSDALGPMLFSDAVKETMAEFQLR